MLYYQQKKKGNTEPLSVTLQKWTGTLLHILISIYVLFILVVLPCYFRDGYTLIATRKAVLFQEVCKKTGLCLALALPVHLAISYVTRRHRQGNAAPARENLLRKIKASLIPTDVFVGLYGVAVVVSYLCSRYQDVAFWGTDRGWYTGLFTQMAFVCSYFLISRAWRPGRLCFYLIYPVSFVIFLLGYLNRFSYYPIPMAYSSPSFISTIGNINWYCDYAVTVFAAGATLFWRDGGRNVLQNALFSLYVWMGFATLVSQGSLSGIVTLGVLALALLCLSAGDASRMRRFWYIALLFSAACLSTMCLRLALPGRMNFEDRYFDLLTDGPLPVCLTLLSGAVFAWLSLNRRYPAKFFRILSRSLAVSAVCALFALIVMITMNTARPGSLGALSSWENLTFSNSWGSGRGSTWKVGILCFAEQDFLHKLVGVGPDAMAAYLYQPNAQNQKSQELVLSALSSRLTNAHCEWLTVLVNTGILGLVGFSGIIVSAIKRLTGAKGDLNSIACSCGMALLAYTVNNLFSFQQVLSTTTAFVLLGMGAAFLRRNLPR